MLIPTYAFKSYARIPYLDPFVRLVLRNETDEYQRFFKTKFSFFLPNEKKKKKKKHERGAKKEITVDKNKYVTELALIDIIQSKGLDGLNTMPVDHNDF